MNATNATEASNVIDGLRDLPDSLGLSVPVLAAVVVGGCCVCGVCCLCVAVCCWCCSWKAEEKPKAKPGVKPLGAEKAKVVTPEPGSPHLEPSYCTRQAHRLKVTIIAPDQMERETMEKATRHSDCGRCHVVSGQLAAPEPDVEPTCSKCGHPVEIVEAKWPEKFVFDEILDDSFVGRCFFEVTAKKGTITGTVVRDSWSSTVEGIIRPSLTPAVAVGNIAGGKSKPTRGGNSGSQGAAQQKKGGAGTMRPVPDVFSVCWGDYGAHGQAEGWGILRPDKAGNWQLDGGYAAVWDRRFTHLPEAGLLKLRVPPDHVSETNVLTLDPPEPTPSLAHAASQKVTAAVTTATTASTVVAEAAQPGPVQAGMSGGSTPQLASKPTPPPRPGPAPIPEAATAGTLAADQPHPFGVPGGDSGV